MRIKYWPDMSGEREPEGTVIVYHSRVGEVVDKIRSFWGSDKYVVKCDSGGVDLISPKNVIEIIEKQTT